MSDAPGAQVKKVAAHLRSFALDLILTNTLRQLDQEHQYLEGRCAFFAEVHGRHTQFYKDAVIARDMLSTETERLLREWETKRVGMPQVVA